MCAHARARARAVITAAQHMTMRRGECVRAERATEMTAFDGNATALNGRLTTRASLGGSLKKPTSIAS